MEIPSPPPPSLIGIEGGAGGREVLTHSAIVNEPHKSAAYTVYAYKPPCLIVKIPVLAVEK